MKMVAELNSAECEKQENEKRFDNDIELGKFLGHAPPGEEVVITGMSGAFPSSNDVHEYRDNLYNKIDMVTPVTRWKLKHPEIPDRAGNVPEVRKFDAGFFGVHQRQANTLDPMTRLLLEKTTEAIMDAGLHPSDLENTRTGVFSGTSFSETEVSWTQDRLVGNSFLFTGLGKTMVVHRISHFFKFQGPSLICDSACSSSLYAVEHAFRAIRLGEIDNAIVAGTNLNFEPFINLQFARLGVLSHDGACKVFDKSGNGYARADTVAVVLLQRAKSAKRVYAQIVHAKTNCDGYKTQGITFPSRLAQQTLMSEVYEECEIDPFSLSYLEAHGTGTVVGDPEEGTAIDNALAKGRKTPLLLGSVKSNIGHSEPSSGLCSVVKCIIGMENELIPPNIHFSIPREEIHGIIEGRMEVVTEKMPFRDDRGLIGINSFGFGGGNCHVLLRWNTKQKITDGLPADNLPRLVCVSGRSEEAVTSILNELRDNKLDAEHIRLLHNVFRKNIPNHLHRGYSIINKSAELHQDLEVLNENYHSLYVVFGELVDWHEVGNNLMAIPVFADSIQRIQKHLSNKGVNIIDVILKKSLDRELNHVLGNVAVQIGIIDVFKLVEIKPKYSLGYSFGELLAAYFDGVLTLKETIDCAFIINESVNDVNNLKNKGIQNGNHDAEENPIETFRLALNSKSQTAFRKQLLENLNNILIRPKAWKVRGSKSDYASAEYFLNAISGKDVRYATDIEKRSLVLVTGRAPIELNIDAVKTIYFAPYGSDNHVTNLLKLLGSLYLNGFCSRLANLYPRVEFPVSRGTRMISPYIKWKHDRKWFCPEFDQYVQASTKHGIRTLSFKPSDNNWKFLDGHVIDGRKLFPATGYLILVWETLSSMESTILEDTSVVFENCRFLRATTVPKEGHLRLHITIQKGSGNFEVVEGDTAVVTGKIRIGEASPADLVKCYYEPTGANTRFDIPWQTRDIYKEMRLRGYNYTQGFRSIQKCDSTASKGYIKWDNNWITFLDNMLQMKILQTDSRLLYVPTFISKLVIPAKLHLDWINKEYTSVEKPAHLPVTSDKSTGIVSCGDIKLIGLLATSIAHKKDLGVPVLESYKFVPNVTELQTEESVRVNMQILLENALTYKVKAVELIDSATDKDSVPLLPIVQTVLEDQPLIQPTLLVLSSNPLEISVPVEDKKLSTETECLLIVASNILGRPEVLQEALASLKDDGFIISRESLDFRPSSEQTPDLNIFTEHRTPTETLVMLRKKPKFSKTFPLKISEPDQFSWIEKLKSLIKKKNRDTILLYSENEPLSGVLGLVNCLKREPESRNVKCLFMMDETERKFDENDPFYAQQLGKDMAINVYKNGEWGTYRHLLNINLNNVESEHAYVNVTVRGDLSSLSWLEGPIKHNMVPPPEKTLIYIHYAALNFRDIMTASGRIRPDVVTQNRLEQECVQGFEFSGVDAKGNRVTGMVTHGALSTLLLADSNFLIKVPDSMTLEEAATIPVVYGTVFYALVARAQIKRGETVLIHSGTGGVGQAAIRLALSYGCTVFTTVGTKEKREFLKATFPQLKDHNIGNSRDLSFEQMVYKQTKGRGVDIVLNSLAEDKLIASIRCLAQGGRFMEIGKFDLSLNKSIDLLLLQKDASFQVVMLDQLFNETPAVKQQILKLLREGFESGVIQPLNRTIFKYDEVEQAFRYMASGKHMGKVLVQVRETKPDGPWTPSVEKFPALARYVCYPDRTYIIAGGLGGFGLELADWLILRGARKLVLTSRKGISTGYQNFRMRIWQSYGATVLVSQADITTKEGCDLLIRSAQEMGPIEAIFNLAVVLADAIFENQTKETFQTSFGPKAVATAYLDEVCRKLCPTLSDFVVFSSITCGRGNAGQTNYGMANSIMERICEKRRQDGYPALAIEWGAIGDVGLVAEMQEEHIELEIGGTLQQKISNCLNVLDGFMRQKDSAIVSSMVVAEKRGGANAGGNIVDAVINILGLTDTKTISLHLPLAELGMDSMTGIEIKQTLERDFEVFLNPKDIRTMTLARLKDIQDEKNKPIDLIEVNKNFGFDMVFRTLTDESQSRIPIVRLKSLVEVNETAPKVILFPGIDGFAATFEHLSDRLKGHLFSLQYGFNPDEKTIGDLVQSILPTVEQNLTKSEPFKVLAYSFGSIVALEVLSILEAKGYTGSIVLIDGSFEKLKQILDELKQESEELFETALLCQLLSFHCSPDIIAKHEENIFKCRSWNDRLDICETIIKDLTNTEKQYNRTVANTVYNRIKAIGVYTPSYSKLSAKAKLYKPNDTTFMDISEDYGLSEQFKERVEIETYDGNHSTILVNELMIKSLNTWISDGL